ncbi:hypothetical protein NPIL_234661 [Nephila pilipes]|uniref:Uncharacterized protein n=1 Tax=Nephila pilipes TaxID=299642 RepID=A0A8X6PWS1_NEPPI|nr:hypothetical protein NPIL_234661 [Nephila pilipes]
MLLGADVISVILSGRTIKLKSGLIAIGTMLGFTLMGKTSQIVNDNNEISVPTTRERQLKLDVVPLDADAPKIPSANVDVSESTMIPVDARPNRPKLSRYGRTIRRPKRLSVFNNTTVFESE